jgi:hypothetical protein
MDKISKEDKLIIRKYWATYYKKNEEIELLHRQRERQMISLKKFEEKQKDSSFERSDFYLYCDKMSKLYRDYATADETIACKIDSATAEIDDAEEDYNVALDLNGLEIEQRDYEEDLYNLVNGLEEEEYQKF